MNDNVKITCDNCGYSEIKITNKDWCCPDCGKNKCLVEMSFSDKIGPIHESISGKQFNPTKRKAQGKTGKSVKKPIQEFFHGDDYSHKLEKFVDKDRILDRENDHYYEMVKDKETGEIIHHQTEKLSEHYGHGSAKKSITWDIDATEKLLINAFNNNSEIELLSILKNNSFLFYELYSRKYGIRPVFKEISFGDTYRCDYAWLNDNSDGPEWVLVEVEKPQMNLFTKKGEPTAELNHALGQLGSWERYFDENPGEKSRIFGAVSKFRYILVAGSSLDWQTESAQKWRIHHNKKSNFEIRSIDVFKRPLEVAKNKFEELWSFEENPIALKHSDLKHYWESCPYMSHWRKIIN